MYPKEQGIGILSQVKKPGPITRTLAASGIAQMPILADQRIAFADGGRITDGGIARQETADELMARMTAKYGVPAAGPTTPPVAAQPATQPKPDQPKPAGSGLGILGVLRGRKEAIDKAAGFSRGGKISGPGTPTSDSIPAKVRETGEGILVSNRERIVSADQEKALQHVAQGQGFDSVDSMLEGITGKPVGPTIKSTQRAAADGLSPETDPDMDGRRTYSTIYGDAFANRGGSFAPNGPSNGPDSTALNPLTSGIAAPIKTGSAHIAQQIERDMTAGPSRVGLAKPEIQPVNGYPAAFAGSGSAGIVGGPQSNLPLRTTDILPGGYIDRGSGILASRESNGRLNVTNLGTENFTDSGKGILDGSASALIDQKNSTYNPARQLENMQRLRMTSDLTNPEITDPAVRENAIKALGIMSKPTAGALTTERTRGQQLLNEQSQRLNDLQQQLVEEGDSDKRMEIAGQIKALTGRAQQSRQGEMLTLPQRRSNFEITAARKAVAGLTPEEIKQKTANYTATGRENPNYDPTLAKAVSLAGRRMYGDDAEFDQRQQQEQAQQPVGNDGDVMTRFRADAGMKGHKLGKQTDSGHEVLDGAGKVIGHYR